MNDEPVKEGAVLSNFVPILNLMDSNGNQGFSSKRGVVPNKIWNAEKNHGKQSMRNMTMMKT
ncbi:hypothetical protein E6P74_05020 [Moraxella lacunata]|uniref:hypothetical protein n=1 Tax=Moraxella lacunata TaxID=477 RepID=UPI0024A671A4|nr:hypothetical protein [Moraxella lacunata]MDI4482687.1 hypothetical protein [Moraxella lacunata]